MNKEEKTTTFDYFKVSRKARLVLDGNEYKLFTAIAERCNVNDNWWSITNENLQKESGLGHRALLRCKKDLEERGFIINLNKNIREEDSYKTKTSKLSISVEKIMNFEVEDTTTPDYNFNKKSNSTKSTKITPTEELGADVAPKSKEEELGADVAPNLGAESEPNLGADVAPLKRITKEEKENNNINYSTVVPAFDLEEYKNNLINCMVEFDKSSTREDSIVRYKQLKGFDLTKFPIDVQNNFKGWLDKVNRRKKAEYAKQKQSINTKTMSEEQEAILNVGGWLGIDMSSML